jgi:hypothetical protein
MQSLVIRRDGAHRNTSLSLATQLKTQAAIQGEVTRPRQATSEKNWYQFIVWPDGKRNGPLN